MPESPQMTVRRAAELIQSRALSAEDLARDVLITLERTDRYVHAYAHVDADGALARAREADRELRRGGLLGPLHGVPVAIKDVLLTADMPTEAGSRVLKGFVASYDATVVRLLRAAGANIVGKLVTHEFACGTDRPPTRNAWRLDHYPGGSSAGAGPAVAVGSALAAIGTDSGGSVRVPAALNGVTGLKPTYGRVSRHGVIPLGSSLDHVGVLARTADDCGLVLEVLGRPDASDPNSTPGAPFEAMHDAGLSGRRLGVDRASLEWTLDEEIREAFEAALQALVDLDATLVDVELPPRELVDGAGFTIFLAEAAAYHREWLADRPQDYAPATRQTIQVGALIPASDVDLAQRVRRSICSRTAAVFEQADLDAVVSPTVPMTAIPMAEMVPSDVGRYLPYLFPANLTGQPAISVPCGFTAAGLPIGLQVIGAPMADNVVVAVGAAYQRVTAWHERSPEIPAGQPPDAEAVLAAHGGDPS